MPKNAKLLTVLLIFLGLGLPLFFISLKLKNTATLNLQLKNQLQLQQREATDKLHQLDKGLKEKEKQLQELSDVQAIRLALNSAQFSIDRLNRELEQAKSERAGLQETSINISNRLDNTSRELMRTTEELRMAKEEISNLEKSKVFPLKERIEEYSKAGDIKGKDAEGLKQELTRLQQANLAMANNNKSLEEKIKSLDAERLSLQAKLDGLQRRVAKEGAPEKTMQGTVNQLNAVLAGKENQLRLLEAELAKVNSAKGTQEARIAQQQRMINELNSSNQNMNSEITQLSAEVSQKKVELEIQKQDMLRLKQDAAGLQEKIASLEPASAGQRAGKFNDRQQEKAALEETIKKLQDDLGAKNSAISALTAEKEKLIAQAGRLKTQDSAGADDKVLYEQAKEQLGRLAEILVKKDLELDKARRESQEASDSVTALQAKLTGLERNLNTTQASRDGARRLEEQKNSLQERLQETQDALSDKTELVDSLQKNVDILNRQLTKKDTERKSVEAELADLTEARDSAQEELARENERYGELDAVNKGLKAQLTQISETLTQKELELEHRRNEIFSLKEDIESMKYRYTRLEKELTNAKERQKKIIDDLGSAVQLNTELQQRIVGVSQSLESGESVKDQKKKAEELRRKIKVFLEPEKN